MSTLTTRNQITTEGATTMHTYSEPTEGATMTTTDLSVLTDRELARDIASALRDRDASYAAGDTRRYPAALARLRSLRAERARRRALPRSFTPAAEVDWCDDAGCPRVECVACQREATS